MTMGAGGAKTRSVVLAGGCVVVIAAVVIWLVLRPSGQLRISPGVLPLTRARIGTTYVDCSMVGLASYVPNRPCDTYFLVRGGSYRNALALLESEQQRLRDAGWRYAPATTWGQTLAADGWIGPHHQGCAVVMTAADGARAQARLEAAMVMEPGFVHFGAAARAASHTPTLEVLLQPGDDQSGRPRC